MRLGTWTLVVLFIIRFMKSQDQICIRKSCFLNDLNTSKVHSKGNIFCIIVVRISTLFFKTGLIHIVCQDTILRVNMSDSLTSLSSTVTEAKD